MNAQIPLRLPPAVRRRDPSTSHDAADRHPRSLGALHQEVMDAFRTAERERRTLTDEELERLPQFAHLAPSTVRKRRSELYQAGWVREAGSILNSRGCKMIRWAPV